MIASLLSGLLAALAFPFRAGDFSSSLWPLAWFALIPTYLSSVRSVKKGKVLFWHGIATGFPLYGLSLYWIFIAMKVHGNVSTSATLFSLFILVTILSLYLGLAFSLARWLCRHGLPFSVSFIVMWLLQDWARNFFPFGGFSWSSLAYSQTEALPFLQVVDVTGPYGITFLILIGNVFLGEIILYLKKERGLPKHLLLLFIITVGGSSLYGLWREHHLGKTWNNQTEKNLILIQGNVPQEEKWLTTEIEEIVFDHVGLTKEAEGKYPADLILWPEASYPAVIPPGFGQIKVIDQFKSPLLMGAVTYQGGIPEEWPPTEKDNFRLHNSALLIEPGGFLRGEYHKNHLVPVGEYVPMKKALFFLSKIVPGYADFSSGGSFHLLETSGMKMGVTICYEDLFPEISRRFVQGGADLLINLTNDAWYERSSAIDQHVLFSRFRAMENRRYLARATNTGVTVVFDPIGREIARAPLFQSAILPSKIRLGGPVTFYTRFGDVFMIGCLVLLLGLHLRTRFKRN
ncbi:MAG: apolipoprotein N-acyltransferase [Deltaproteobacteria bacterium]|nr:apolipoprotein N-acyltransferase [Deltaproteobacteria bacterium]